MKETEDNMKTIIRLSQEDVAMAITIYLKKVRNLDVVNVKFRCSECRDYVDRPIGGYFLEYAEAECES